MPLFLNFLCISQNLQVGFLELECKIIHCPSTRHQDEGYMPQINFFYYCKERKLCSSLIAINSFPLAGNAAASNRP